LNFQPLVFHQKISHKVSGAIRGCTRKAPDHKSPSVERRKMAAPEFTSREQEGLYRLLVVLNSSLQFMIKRLEEIAANKILDAEYINKMSVLTQDVQTTLDELTKPKTVE
jgi:hypothetical protein